jgi:hypothetical protein
MFYHETFLHGTIPFGQTEPKAISTVEAYRGVEVQLLSFLILALSGQFHDQVPLLPKKQPSVFFGCESFSEFEIWSGRFGDKSCLCWELNEASTANWFIYWGSKSLCILVFNILKPTGYVMHQQVHHSTIVGSAHTLSENKQRLLQLTP